MPKNKPQMTKDVENILLIIQLTSVGYEVGHCGKYPEGIGFDGFIPLSAPSYSSNSSILGP